MSNNAWRTLQRLTPPPFLTPCRGLTLIKQVVPVTVANCPRSQRGGGALQHFFLGTPPLSPPLPSPELACRYFARQLSTPLAQTAGNSSKFKDPAGTWCEHRPCAPGKGASERARSSVSMRAFSNFPCSCCSRAASIDAEQLWQTQSTAGVPT